MAKPSIGVVLPAHPARVANGMLDRALRSVWAQTVLPDEIHVALDLDRQGAAVTRGRGLHAVNADYVAFLDSDDEMLPQHLERLIGCVQATGAVFAFSWFEPVGAPDPLGHFGLPFNPATPHHTTMTVLVKTDLARRVGFTPGAVGDPFGNEDWRFICDVARLCVESGDQMIHVPEKTWRWHIHGANTSGQPHKGDAR